MSAVANIVCVPQWLYTKRSLPATTACQYGMFLRRWRERRAAVASHGKQCSSSLAEMVRVLQETLSEDLCSLSMLVGVQVMSKTRRGRGNRVVTSTRAASAESSPQLELHFAAGIEHLLSRMASTMPPRIPRTLRQLQSRTVASKDDYVCESCLRRGLSQQTRGLQRHSLPQKTSPHNGSKPLPPRRPANLRYPSTGARCFSNGSLASSTAINAPSTVPAAYRDLYQRLQALQESASSYVDLSRLQLALRSLESSRPVVRIALLGLGKDGALAARKLARALLSDPLSDEEGWERKILNSMGDGRNLLLRYGETEDDAMVQAGQNPLLQTLQVPSPFLRQQNVEVLVSNLNANGNAASNATASLEEAILVPSLTTPTSAGGRVGFVRYPVHKAVIVTEGISGAVEIGRHPADLFDGKLISSALSVPLRQSNSATVGEQAATSNAVDIDLALHALGLFRTSRANGAKFSEEWQTSRMPAIADWIAGSSHDDASLSPDVQKLVISLIRSSSSALSLAESLSTTATTQNSTSNDKRTALQSAISTWSANGHRDLQSNLVPALSDSGAWRRTVWWRLFWRIDDVANSTSELLRQNWLTEVEQRLAFLCGQIVEAGLADQEQMRKAGTFQIWDEGKMMEMAELETKNSTETAAQLLRLPSMLASMQQQSGVNALFDPPWPQTINQSRQYLIKSVVPALHTRAQALLFAAVSTIAGSTALGAWFYIATSGIALYESGAVAALGLVWALRRLQRKWSLERALFADSVREDGRKVLGEVEEGLRNIVREGGRASVRPEDAVAWREAGDALQQCREALEAVQTNC